MEVQVHTIFRELCFGNLLKEETRPGAFGISTRRDVCKLDPAINECCFGLRNCPSTEQLTHCRNVILFVIPERGRPEPGYAMRIFTIERDLNRCSHCRSLLPT